MNVYIYQAALYCEDCGDAIRNSIPQPDGADLQDESTYDSDQWPKGPYPDGGGKSNSPEHCDACGLFLENPLTSDRGRAMIRPEDIPNSTPATLELEAGWTAEIRVEHDDDTGPPWEEQDGHGPVSDWRPWRDFGGGYDQKRAGERVLVRDRSSARYYDFAEAVRIAKRDGWGPVCCAVCGAYEDWPGGHGAHGFRPESKGRTAARAAEADFEYLRAWCNDKWEWLIVSVTVRDAEGEEAGRASCGGVESTGDYWKQVAVELIEEAAMGIAISAYEGKRG